MPREISKYINRERAVVFNLDQFCPPGGHMAISGDIFDCHNWGERVCATGFWWVEAEDAAKYPTMYRTALYTQTE